MTDHPSPSRPRYEAGATYTTIVVGPDGREYDLGRCHRERRWIYPARDDYMAKNAFTRRKR